LCGYYCLRICCDRTVCSRCLRGLRCAPGCEQQYCEHGQQGKNGTVWVHAIEKYSAMG
jgi:hypothetical protein